MGKVTAKGQITIPKHIRDQLGLRPGAEVTFEVGEDGRAYLTPLAARSKSRFARFRGSLRTEMTTDEIMALLRGEDDK